MKYVFLVNLHTSHLTGEKYPIEACWDRPAIPATLEAEAGGPEVQGLLKLKTKFKVNPGSPV